MWDASSRAVQNLAAEMSRRRDSWSRGVGGAAGCGPCFLCLGYHWGSACCYSGDANADYIAVPLPSHIFILTRESNEPAKKKKKMAEIMKLTGSIIVTSSDSPLWMVPPRGGPTMATLGPNAFQHDW